MTISRLRQISAAIDEAEWQKQFYKRQLVAWQTRMICSWMVKLTSDMEPDLANKLMQEAASISLDGMTPENSEESETSSKKPAVKAGIPTRKDFYDMDDSEIEKYLGQAENGEGSFEALLQGFGKR